MAKQTIGQTIAPPRFILFVVVLVAVTIICRSGNTLAGAFMMGFDAAATTFLIVTLPMLRVKGRVTMQRNAVENDANRAVLLGMATVVLAAIMVSVAVELADPKTANKPLIVGTLALAWLFANTVYALHYAHVYYLEGSNGGLKFAGDSDDPDYSDFVYFAFTLGMTFQTSDTEIETRQLRQIVTIHSLAAFVFNIGVIAFSINVLGAK